MSVKAPPRQTWCICRYETGACLQLCTATDTCIDAYIEGGVGSACDHFSLDAQADKADAAQQRLADALLPFDPHSGVAEAVVVGCGPAGLSLAAELAARGVRAVLIGELERCHDVIYLAKAATADGRQHIWGTCRA